MEKFLCVGINHFMVPGNDLAGCVADARSMGAVAQVLGITPDTLTDKQATKKNIMNWLASMVAAAQEDTISYIGFAYSAHGTHYPRSEEEDGLGEALVCHDIAEKDGDWDPKTIIKDTELRDLLNQVPQTCIVETWLDTCYSGGMDRGLRSTVPWRVKGKYLHNPGNPDKILRLANSNMNLGLNSNIIMWCASSEGQTSADAYLDGGAHGAFTYYWVKTFKDYSQKRRVDLLLRTRQYLRGDGFGQFPRLKCWNGPAQRAVGK